MFAAKLLLQRKGCISTTQARACISADEPILQHFCVRLSPLLVLLLGSPLPTPQVLQAQHDFLDLEGAIGG